MSNVNQTKLKQVEIQENLQALRLIITNLVLAGIKPSVTVEDGWTTILAQDVGEQLIDGTGDEVMEIADEQSIEIPPPEQIVEKEELGKIRLSLTDLKRFVPTIAA